jgi:hypothetical protein
MVSRGDANPRFICLAPAANRVLCASLHQKETHESRFPGRAWRPGYLPEYGHSQIREARTLLENGEIFGKIVLLPE